MASKDFGKRLIHIAKKGKHQEFKDINLEDQSLIAKEIDFTIYSGGIFQNSYREIYIEIPTIQIVRGAISTIEIHRIDDIDNVIYESNYNNSFLKITDLIPLDSLPKSISYYISIKGIKGNAVISDTQKIDVAGIDSSFQIIEVKNLITKDISSPDIDNLGYQFTENINLAELNIEWFDIKKIKKKSDFTENRISPIFKTTDLKEITLEPLVIANKFSHYVIFKFVANSSNSRPKYLLPLNYKKYSKLPIDEESGYWDRVGETTDSHFSIKLEPKEVCAFWVGAVFDE